MTNIFFTADHHFDHANVISHCDRPFDNVNHMNEELVKRWNETVPSKGLTYIVGDFAWKNHLHWLYQLNGKKILIVGNHDKMSQKILNQFTETHHLRTIQINRQSIILCHYRLSVWPGKYRGQWHLYGHSHGRAIEHDDTQACDVGVDIWDYKPVPYEVLAKKMADRAVKKSDPEGRAFAIQTMVSNRETNLRYLRRYHEESKPKTKDQDTGSD